MAPRVGLQVSYSRTATYMDSNDFTVQWKQWEGKQSRLPKAPAIDFYRPDSCGFEYYDE